MQYNAEHSKNCFHASSPKSQNLDHKVGIEVDRTILDTVCVFRTSSASVVVNNIILTVHSVIQAIQSNNHMVLARTTCYGVSLLSNVLISVVADSDRSPKVEIRIPLLPCHLYSTHPLHRNLSPMTFPKILHKINIFPLRQTVFFFLGGW